MNTTTNFKIACHRPLAAPCGARSRHHLFATTVALAALLLSTIGSATPQTYTVTNAFNAGPGSLAQAIIDANANPGHDTINYDPGISVSPHTITLGSGYTIDDAVTIDGPSQPVTLSGASTHALTVAGSGDGTVTIRNLIIADGVGMLIEPGASVTLENVTISGCSSAAGGAIEVEDATLSCHSCVFAENSSDFLGGAINARNSEVTLIACSVANNTGGGNGGGIWQSGGTLAIFDSTISGNEGAAGGGLNLRASSTIANSTISGNRAISGGAMTLSSSAEVLITHCTVVGNTVETGIGGGIKKGGTNNVRLRNSIVASNTAASDPDLHGTFISEGNNLIGDAASSTGLVDGVNGDIVGDAAAPAQPRLGPLQDNGGATLTHAPRPASPAINAGSTAAISECPFLDRPYLDQRGNPRVQGAAVDIGAVEFGAGQEFVVTNTNDSGIGSLRLAIHNANTKPGFDVVTFDTLGAFADDATITLTSGYLEIADSVMIDGPGSNLILSGNNTSKVFWVNTSGPAATTMRRLTIADGYTSAHGGGIDVNRDAELVLEKVVMKGCEAGLDGDALWIVGSATLRWCTIENCTGEHTVYFGSGFEIEGAKELLVEDSTIANNAGSGISSLWHTTVRRSTFSGNASGGILLDSSGGDSGSAEIFNTTISGNSSPSDGGGLKLLSGTWANLINSTVVENTASGNGGGTYVDQGASLSLGNTIVSGNIDASAVGGNHPDISGEVESFGHNLITDPTGATIVGVGFNDIVGQRAHLGPLSHYGGPTKTHPPLAISPVIDAGGPSAFVLVDQRGFERDIDGDLSGVAAYDIGAVEAGEPLVVAAQTDFNSGSGILSLRTALETATEGDRILFDPALSGATINLDSNPAFGIAGLGIELPITETVQIDATRLPGGITVSGGSDTRVFTIAEGIHVAMHALTICEGNAGNANGDADGGGIQLNGSLVMSHCCLEGNFAQDDGGGISAEDGSSLHLFNCTVSGNNVRHNGGAIALHGEVEAKIEHCTIASNATTDSILTGGIALGTSSIECYSSIFSDNVNAGGLDGFDSDGLLSLQVVSRGYNLTDINATNAFNATGDQPGVDPMLLPLLDTGGWVPSHNLISTSPAIDAGDPGASSLHTFDSTGFLRITGGTIDIGAVESLSRGDGDADGIPDYWELLHGLDPSDPTDATEDPNGDGEDNLTEFQNGGDPQAVPNYPDIEILDFTYAPNGLSVDLVFTSEPDVDYGIYHSTDLQNWALLFVQPGFDSLDRTPIGITFSVFGLSASNGFFRVEQQ